MTSVRFLVSSCLALAVLLGGRAALAAQSCHAGAHAGVALTRASLPLGNFRDDPTRGPSLGLDLGCEVGDLDVGVRPEMAAMGSIMAWSFLASAGARFPRLTDRPQLRVSAVAGLLVADDGTEGVNVIFPGPRVRTPQSGPLFGGSLRLAFPATGGSSFYIEGSVRIGLLDQVIEPAGEDDGDRTLVYWPLSVGYSLGL